jgi:uncharacterized protein YjbI with pentapeptide repeats
MWRSRSHVGVVGIVILRAVAGPLAGVHGFGIEARPKLISVPDKGLSLQPIAGHVESGEVDVNYCSDSGALSKSVKLVATMLLGCLMAWPLSSMAATTDDAGASASANAKIATGGASTLQSGRTISITRGVNLDNSDFSNMNLKGVAFQQSIVRDSNFANSNLVGASFFDATIDGSNFENANLSQANLEMAQLNRANLRNAVAREMYVSGATLFTGIASVEGSDWTDTYLRADQQKYLCEHPTAKGINPTTKVSTRESLMCPD